MKCSDCVLYGTHGCMSYYIAWEDNDACEDFIEWEGKK